MKQHPLGGGFGVSEISHITLPFSVSSGDDGPAEIGRAFHSIWFEVLGTQGIPGMMIFVMMIATFYINSYRVFKRYRADAALHWASALAWYLMASVTVWHLAGGSFIGVGFQPFLYNMLAAGIVLRECARKLETSVKPPVDATRIAAAACAL